MSRRKKKYLEGIIEKVNFPNMSEFTFEDKKVNFKGGIEGQKVSVVVGRKREKHMEAKLLEILEVKTENDFFRKLCQLFVRQHVDLPIDFYLAPVEVMEDAESMEELEEYRLR